jgi:hypothetical protein
MIIIAIIIIILIIAIIGVAERRQSRLVYLGDDTLESYLWFHTRLLWWITGDLHPLPRRHSLRVFALVASRRLRWRCQGCQCCPSSCGGAKLIELGLGVSSMLTRVCSWVWSGSGGVFSGDGGRFGGSLVTSAGRCRFSPAL